MLLTNTDMQSVRQAVETQSGLDQELIERCSPLVHIAAFDEAVRQAFVVLEERLRQTLKKERATGMQSSLSPIPLLFSICMAQTKSRSYGFQ